jgi:hypothetical protein
LGYVAELTNYGMKQYELQNNVLQLNVKQAPGVIRFVFFLFSFLTFIAPVAGLVFSIYSGGGVHLGFFVAIGLFGLLGFYMLKISLWNTYGSEKIVFGKSELTYQADYGWFRGEVKSEDILPPLQFSFYSIGYSDEGLGSLQIDIADKTITCVTKMPKESVVELLKQLKSLES